MRQIGFICAVLGALGALSPQTALAQNVVSYVASTGNDANLCYNPANACRFLPRAFDRTIAGGEIFVLDSGTFAGNGLVITKAISVVAKGVQADVAGDEYHRAYLCFQARTKTHNNVPDRYRPMTSSAISNTP